MGTSKRDLQWLDGPVANALGDFPAPACVIDPDGRVLWLNASAVELVGDVLGQTFRSFVAPEHVAQVREQFAKKLLGETKFTEYDLTMIDRAGRRIPVRLRSVVLRDGDNVTGVLGIAIPDGDGSTDGTGAHGMRAAPKLTGRQQEILQLLGQGLGTAAIAERLGLAEQTVRNHIRGILAALQVHSRLEAIAAAYRLNLLDPPTTDGGVEVAGD